MERHAPPPPLKPDSEIARCVREIGEQEVPRPLLRVPDIARWMGCEERQVYWRVAKGQIPVVRIGGNIFFDPKIIEDPRLIEEFARQSARGPVAK